MHECHVDSSEKIVRGGSLLIETVGHCPEMGGVEELLLTRLHVSNSPDGLELISLKQANLDTSVSSARRELDAAIAPAKFVRIHTN